jgi:hypothetical protein
MMAKQNSTEQLKEKIRLLEIRQAEEGKMLRAQFDVTVESLKPVNLLKNAAQEFTSSAELRETILESSAIVVAGFISKKLLNLTKGGPLLRLISSLLQLSTTGLINKYSVQIQDFLLGKLERLLINFNKEKQK